jgi:hypothetical protein
MAEAKHGEFRDLVIYEAFSGHWIEDCLNDCLEYSIQHNATVMAKLNDREILVHPYSDIESLTEKYWGKKKL